jgi:hypothetical protein
MMIINIACVMLGIVLHKLCVFLEKQYEIEKLEKEYDKHVYNRR